MPETFYCPGCDVSFVASQAGAHQGGNTINHMMVADAVCAFLCWGAEP